MGPLPWRLLGAVDVSWVELHGVLTHFPVVLLTVAGALEIGAAALRRPGWRVASFWMLAGAVLTGVPSVAAGWLAAGQVFGGTAPADLALHRLAGMTTVGLAAAVLVARAAHRDRLPGLLLPAATAGLVMAGALVGFTGYLGGRMVFGGSRHESPAATPDPEPSADPAPSGGTVGLRDVERGAQLFGSLRCQSCHTMAGAGGQVGPDLTHEADRHADMAWHVRHLADPSRMSPGSPMPSYGHLPATDRRQLAAYLATRH